MKIIITKNYKEMSKQAAEFIIDEVLKKPNLVLGFPSGETPMLMYKLLVKAYKNKKSKLNKKVDFSKIRCFSIDEYYPIKKSNKNSSYYYLNKNFLSHVNIKKSNINMLDSENENPEKYCAKYEKKIKKNPIDILILGVGVNGHICFNEPGSKFNSKTRIVNLMNKTIKQNSRFFKKINDVPKSAMTMGISTILSSNQIILLASGKNKAKAIKHLINYPISNNYPVSFLKNIRSRFPEEKMTKF